ncbi:MAG TPA: calcium-binding protein [Chroococcidiopsis sp.]
MAKLRGDQQRNVLQGTRFRDTLDGLGGSDRLFGLEGNDILNGGIGSDYLNGGIGRDRLTGGSGNDVLLGGDGGDVLDGGTGRDKMTGGLGNDVYFVDNAGDRVIERNRDDIDTIRSTISLTLGSFLENLTLLGRGPLRGTGNSLNNQIIGNASQNLLLGLAGNDTLEGRLGNDTLTGGDGNDILIGGTTVLDTDVMTGGTGNDAYYVNSVDDVIVELVSADTDVVFLVADTYNGSSYTLADSLEDLEMLGSRSVDGIGNSDGNILRGNRGNNTLSGLGGNDALTGGGGSDRFLFTASAPFSTANTGFDTITDFVQGTDKIVLSKTTFAALTSTIGAGLSVASEVAVVADDGAAALSDAVIVLSQASNTLFYNVNGSATGFGDVDLSGGFAKLIRVSSIAASDFEVVA